MSINLLYIPLFNIEEVILDKDTGLPLAGGVVSFFRDSQRATPKSVFQIAGSSPNYTFTDVGSVLTLGISGTFVDGSGDPFVPYAYPYDADGNVDLYFVTVVSQGGVDQFTREAVPYLSGTNIPSNQRSSTENELSNPQFVEVIFPTSGSTVINVSGSGTVTPIAPNWDIISSGSGTLTLELLQPTAASVPTNPPYALSIAASAGLGASVTLRQTLTNTPSIMRGGFGSGSLTAAILSGGGSTVSMTYSPSTGSSTTIIPNTSITDDGAYHIISNNAAIPQQVNDPADSGYINIDITIPTSRTIAITSIQLVGTIVSVNIPYDEQTAARQKDHLFHYYEDSLVRQSKNSLLVGWNFGLNPWQFYTTALTTLTAQTAYVADQTIIHQATASSIKTAKTNEQVGSGLAIKAITGVADNRFALIQYIDPATIRPFWNSVVSSLARVGLFTTHASQIRIKMRLIARVDLPASISNTEPIASWPADSDPVFSAGWTAIAPLNDPAYILSNQLALTDRTLGDYPSFAFDQFDLPSYVPTLTPTGTNTLGVVIYTMDAMNNSAGTEDQIIFDDVSLVPNEFGLETQAQTYDEVLRRCEYYYEKSYDSGILPGTVSSAAGAILAEQKTTFSAAAGGTLTLVPRSVGYEFRTPKRTDTPALAFYAATSGTAANFTGHLINNALSIALADVALAGNWNGANVNSKAFWFFPASIAGLLSTAGIGSDLQSEAFLIYHVIIDARLGL